MTAPLRFTILALLALCIVMALPSRRAEACNRHYLIFFDDRSTVISDRGGLFLAEFVRHFMTRELPDPRRWPPSVCQPLRPGNWSVVILAHADDPGMPDQCALSFARGHAVRAHLASLGIPEASMGIQAFGDGSKLVPTEPAAPDPQNRRVEVMVVPGEQVTDEGGPYPRWTPRPGWRKPELRDECPPDTRR